jgi:hypothetical protein
MMEEEETTLSWWNPESNRFWSILFMVGIILHIVATSSSELGLDAYIHSTYVTVEDGTGEAKLDWGHTRPIDPESSDPDYSPDVGGRYWAWHAWLGIWFDFMGNEVDSIQTGAMMMTALMLFAIWRSTEKLYGTEAAARLTALASVNPALIFSAGRVYPEEFMLIAISIAMLTLILGLRTGGKGMPILWLMAPGAVLFGATVKGIDPTTSVLLFILGFVVFAIDESNELLIKVTRRPHRAFIASSLLVVLVFLGFALTAGEGSTISALRRAPLRFSSAVLFSLIDVVLIFMIFGMVLWPFLKESLASSITIIDREAGLLAAVIGGMTTAIVLYVASLWTHESLLWNAEWPWMIWIMGNNGRYATMLLIPCFWYIMRVRQLTGGKKEDNPNEVEGLENLGVLWKPVLVGICLILPLSFFAAVHGQTSWTSEAAEYLSEEMEDGEDFLFISDSTLGMHWLYSFHLQVDADGSRNITGHWRADTTDWQDELVNQTVVENRGNLSDVNWLVISPDIQVELEGWSINKKASAPLMNGGGDWTIWSKTN